MDKADNHPALPSRPANFAEKQELFIFAAGYVIKWVVSAVSRHYSLGKGREGME